MISFENLELKLSLTINALFPSLNAWYSMNDKFVRIKHKKKYGEFLYTQMKDIDIKIDTFFIELRYNNRCDCDNNIPIIKILCDVMKDKQIIMNDNKKYFKGLLMRYDDTIKKNSYVINIYEQIKKI